MNRILLTARCAKGLTEKEIAEELKISENLYKEIELGISSITAEMATILETIYSVPAYYFATDYLDNLQTGTKALEKQKEIINATRDINNISVFCSIPYFTCKNGLDALIAKQEQILLLNK